MSKGNERSFETGDIVSKIVILEDGTKAKCIRTLIKNLESSLRGALSNDLADGAMTHMTREAWLEFCVYDWDMLE